jgi:hypothetical protein
MTPALDVLAGLLRYILLCAISASVGLAIIRLLRVSLSQSSALMLAPVVALAWWAVVLGFSVSFGVPVSILAGPVWAASLGLSAYGIGASARHVNWQDARRVAFTAALPVLILMPYFLIGLADYPGSALADGWSYVAFGQYLWMYPNGTEGGLAPLHQYAAHLVHTRYLAASLLGFFSPFFSPGDTQASSGLFLAWAVFVFSTSCAFFALSIGLRALQLVTYLVFVVLSGWIVNLVWANNYDNALALSFAPALAGLIIQFDLDARGWRVLLALIGAALFYVYPEMAPIVLALAVFVALDRWRRETTPLGRWALVATTAGTLALAMTWPFVPDLVAFISVQTSVGLQAAGRPGEGMFPGLLSLRFQPSAFWGLGGEFRVERFLPLANLLGVVLSMLAATGLVRLLRSRQAGVSAWLVLLVTAAVAMIVAAQYSYGAYKLILLSWWMLGMAVVLGIDAVVASRPLTQYARAVRVGACTALIAAALVHAGIRNRRAVDEAGRWTMADYRQVRTIEDLKLPKKVLIAVDEPVANEWAVYFLRDVPVALGSYRLYMAFSHVRPLMDRARSIPQEDIGYVLTDDHPEAAFRDPKAWSLVWAAGPYRLWAPKAERWAILTGVTNPYGLEEVGGKPFFWMGPAASSLDVLSSADGELGLRAAFIPGPSVAGVPSRRLLVTTTSGYSRELLVHGGERLIRIPVKAGSEQISMTVLDVPTSPAPNGDPRALVLGVQDLSVELTQPRVAVQRVENRNGLEQVDGRPFFWIGDGDTIVWLEATEAGTVRLAAEFVPGPSVSNQAARHLAITTIEGGRTVAIGPGRSSIMAPVRAGENRIMLRPLDRPDRAITGAGDKRPLVLGVRDLQVAFDDRSDEGVVVERIENPNGTEHVDGRPFFWIGGPPTVIILRSTRAADLLLSGRFVAGPSLATATRRLLVATERGGHQTLSIGGGDQTIRVSVPAGQSRITLTALDEPRVLRQPNGDTRPLLLGISGLTATLENVAPPASARELP